MNTDQSTVVDIRSVIHSNPNIVSGTPVFVGTRVPVRSLTDYLASGEDLESFFDDFPSVTREQAIAALEFVADVLISAASAHDRPAR